MKRFAWMWTAAVVAATAAFLAHLAVRHEVVRLGYEVGKARAEQRRLQEQKRLLEVEAAALRQAARIEAIAHGRLGMAPPRTAPARRSEAGGVR